MPRFGGGDPCAVCTKTVYAMEKIDAFGKAWHRTCFKCADCGKVLEVATAADHDAQAYCKSCYGKNFGPKGYGYGQGAGALHLTGK